MSLIYLKVIYYYFLEKDAAVVPVLSGSERVIGSPVLISTGMLGIVSKCHVGLYVAKQHPCVGKDSGGGFSPRYFLVSFQTLTSSSSQPKAYLSVRNKTTPTSGHIEENHLYKGGWQKIGLARREGINQNTPNPGLAFRWSHSLFLTHWMGWRGCPMNANLLPKLVLDTQVWLTARDGDGRSHLYQVLRLTPEVSSRQKLWRGSRLTYFKVNQNGVRGDITIHAFSTWWCLDNGLSSDCSKGFLPVKVNLD